MNPENGELSMEELEKVQAIPVKSVDLPEQDSSLFRKKAIEELKDLRDKYTQGDKKNTGRSK